MSEFAPKLDPWEQEFDSDQPSSNTRPSVKKNGGNTFFTRYQSREFEASFPNLSKVMLDDLETEPSTTGGILGSQEDWTRIENTMDFIDTVALNDEEAREACYQNRQNLPEAPALSEIEKQRLAIQNYLHAIDILTYTPGDDRDAFEEDKKDRRRANPIAKQTARRLYGVLEDAKRRFPDEFVEIELPPVTESEQMYPTSMVPPPKNSPQLKDDLLAKLSTMEEEK